MIGLPNVTSLYVILAFGISYWILKRYLFVPLSAILEARESEERTAEEAYAESVKRLERAVAAGEDKLGSARRDSLRTREDLRAQGLAALEKRLSRRPRRGDGSDRPRKPRDRGAGGGDRAVASRARRRTRPGARREGPRAEARGVILAQVPTRDPPSSSGGGARPGEVPGDSADPLAAGEPRPVPGGPDLFRRQADGGGLPRAAARRREAAKEAEHRRAEVDRLAREIEERTVRLEREIEEIRKQGIRPTGRARARSSRRAPTRRSSAPARRPRRRSRGGSPRRRRS